jgi:hypothetical protein
VLAKKSARGGYMPHPQQVKQRDGPTAIYCL